MGKQDCLFCKIINKEIPAKVVLEDSGMVAFEDVNPQAPVHILIIPKEHIEKISDLSARHLEMVGRLVLAAKEIAKKRGIEESGYRIVMNCNRDAGQAVFHLHLHLLGGRKFSWPPG
ncbi:MAG: histidine triad nucleotide-binding protein [Candidatus Omnitrophica bacterium]|nr:histidine triad nucleotide-binding protein [Candidatus Omnitrophota bacterium]MDD5437302.1 histidine triad nucleotide-binding protein [Candidatus Omnitrophota bacterium]